MKAASPPILLFGQLGELLVTRKWALESRGYRVAAITRLSELTAMPKFPVPRLFLFCGSVSPRVREAAMAFALSRWPRIHCHVLAMDNAASTGLLGRLMHTTEGSDRIVALVAHLLDESKSSSEEVA